MSSLTSEQHSQIQALLDRDRKIDAIKLYREATGVGLAEAKQAVEQLASAGPASSSPALEPSDGLGSDPQLIERVTELLRARQKIEAIKVYRWATGLGLAEAKEAVEAIERRQAPPATGAVQTKQGCTAVVATMLVAGSSLLAWLGWG